METRNFLFFLNPFPSFSLNKVMVFNNPGGLSLYLIGYPNDHFLSSIAKKKNPH